MSSCTPACAQGQLLLGSILALRSRLLVLGAGSAQAHRAAHARSLRIIIAQHPALAPVSSSVLLATAAPSRQYTLTPGTASGAPAPSWAALCTRASAAAPAAQPAQLAPAYLPRTFVPCSLATHSAQGPKSSAMPHARAAACADLPAQGPTPAAGPPAAAAWAAASAPQPPQDVMAMAQRAGIPRGVFYDDRGRRWALGGGGPPVLLPQEPNPKPTFDPSTVPLAARDDAAPSAPSTGVLAAVIVLGLAACGLGAVLAAWCSGVCSPNIAWFCSCCKCAPWLLSCRLLHAPNMRPHIRNLQVTAAFQLPVRICLAPFCLAVQQVR